jgi:hypothetical protein
MLDFQFRVVARASPMPRYQLYQLLDVAHHLLLLVQSLILNVRTRPAYRMMRMRMMIAYSMRW